MVPGTSVTVEYETILRELHGARQDLVIISEFLAVAQDERRQSETEPLADTSARERIFVAEITSLRERSEDDRQAVRDLYRCLLSCLKLGPIRACDDPPTFPIQLPARLPRWLVKKCGYEAQLSVVATFEPNPLLRVLPDGTHDGLYTFHRAAEVTKGLVMAIAQERPPYWVSGSSY